MYKKLFFIFLIVSVSLLSACISRLARPAITGTIQDYQNKPVAGCKVGETMTDANGQFYLKEIRYNKFFIPEMFYMEAPPLHYMEKIEKEGFLNYSIEAFHRFGGGQSKGATANLDTIYIKRINEVIKVEDFIYSNWKFAANKNLDTLYGTNTNFRPYNSVTNSRDFVQKMDYGLDYKFRSAKKPDTTWSAESYDLKTTYFVSLHSNGTYRGKKIGKYQNPWKHRREYDRTYRESYSIADDSLNTSGKFKFSKDKIVFDEAFNRSKNTYKIDSIDRDIIILTRSNN
ncbi:hypothetical protein [Pedobacter punctiformis]|uniref:Carboxypeptidase regulatory-like domain-containing protein n=1 Tax=Pedobacter punctiformis TaxID=3004097 RepID=A0ABT4LCJ9_9SPHI|nr:hypothetical protein [Pedobacter sp. HCMS5-2]MCZ4245629.1 hypothetical protein [Pedobacter sp. HCMS5-2]